MATQARIFPIPTRELMGYYGGTMAIKQRADKGLRPALGQLIMEKIDFFEDIMKLGRGGLVDYIHGQRELQLEHYFPLLPNKTNIIEDWFGKPQITPEKRKELAIALETNVEMVDTRLAIHAIAELRRHGWTV